MSVRNPRSKRVHTTKMRKKIGSSQPYIDENFPIDREVLRGQVPSDAVWLRPYQLCKDPEIFIKGTNHQNVKQGLLGYCWLMAACAALVNYPQLVEELIPKGQVLSNSSPNYTGKIVINLWQNGERNPITIDDRLPTKSGKFFYGSCKDSAEFWLPLVEKALAKYHGGYKNLEKRDLAEGLLILTGYSTYKIDLIENMTNPVDLFERLKEEYKRGSLILCAGKLLQGNRISTVKDRTNGNERTTGYHSFTMADVLSHNSEMLVRIRNPWGMNPDLPDKLRYKILKDKSVVNERLEKLKFNGNEHGEYWILVANFVKYFEEVYIASKNPSVYKDKIVPATETRVARDEWAGKSAAGPFDGDAFDNNPQFLLEIDVTLEGKPDVPVLVELIQDLHRSKYPKPFAAGFYIFQIPGSDSQKSFEEQERYSLDDLMEGTVMYPPVEPDPKCIVYDHYTLEPKQRYVVIAFTKKAGRERGFVLRVHTAEAFIRLRNLPGIKDTNDGEEKYRAENTFAVESQFSVDKNESVDNNIREENKNNVGNKNSAEEKNSVEDKNSTEDKSSAEEKNRAEDKKSAEDKNSTEEENRVEDKNRSEDKNRAEDRNSAEYKNSV